MTAVETQTRAQYSINYKTVRNPSHDSFSREAGPQTAPAILLLHGFPTSSHMCTTLAARINADLLDFIQARATPKRGVNL